MHSLSVQRKTNRRRALAYFACGLFLILADVVFLARVAWAAPAYTPYANSVAAQSGLGGGSANNATGAPNGSSASLLGINSSLTLDMGDGEEGTNALKIYFGPINIQAQAEIEFLDDGQNVITSESRQIFIDLAASTQTFNYDWHDFNKAYRFVRINSGSAISIGVDSVEALGFIGSSASQDTDGDGIPDRQDNQPLAANQSFDGGGGGSDNSNNKSTTNTTIVRTTTSRSSGSTQAINDPPSTKNDKDGDQMDDDWELENKLNPKNKEDAALDPDKDGLANLEEYQFDTNPFKMDTDGDGMPDGWEVENGLNAKADDAEQDPDGDFLTNLGEYHFGSSPYRADDLGALVANKNMGERWWSWAIFAALLALAVLALWRARKLAAVAKHGGHNKKSKKPQVKGSLPPL